MAVALAMQFNYLTDEGRSVQREGGNIQRRSFESERGLRKLTHDLLTRG